MCSAIVISVHMNHLIFTHSEETVQFYISRWECWVEKKFLGKYMLSIFRRIFHKKMRISSIFSIVFFKYSFTGY